MKKIFTLCVALFAAVSMFAQETKGMFEFATADGTVVPSGSVITKSDVEDFSDPEEGVDNMQIPTGLFVKPIKTDLNGEKLCVKLRVDVEKIDHGSIAFCLLGSCSSARSEGTYESNGGFVEQLDDLQTEWMIGNDEETEKAKYGEAKAKLTLVVCRKVSQGKDQFGIEQFKYEDVGESSTVTVKFVYNEKSTGINGISNADATVVARYAADGTRLSAPQKGLNIVKLSNGKTVKYIK
ncbi:hypothetical protein [Leyella stercorea]|uniref:hypothetical protein n=1 Tax=Leyella stercorea TaxID=363265 RepID=UPI00242A36C3|nr:hypothetical protein [Leyella stercorea]